MATTVGETYFCPLPRSFYGPESPCSQTDDNFTGAPQEPFIQPGGSLSGAKWIVYGAVALVVFWLSVRALEAYAELKRT